MSQGLRGLGLSAPEVYAKDLDAGLLIIEDLGGEGVVDGSGPIVERYLEAAGALAYLHAQRLPDVIAVEGGGDYRIPPYDLDALADRSGIARRLVSHALEGVGLVRRQGHLSQSLAPGAC